MSARPGMSIAGDDRLLWDLHLSSLALPAITVALELELFEALGDEPRSADELAEVCGLNQRAMRAVLPVLASVGLLVRRGERFHLSEVATNFLVRGSPAYWGPVFDLIRQVPVSHAAVLAAVNAPPATSYWSSIAGDSPTDAWSQGAIDEATARLIASYMQANSSVAAAVAAERIDLVGVQRLLDVGAGSGCFSISFAQANAGLACTLMDLEGMCDVAMEYVREAKLEQRIKGAPTDMFRQAWPADHDAIFFSNIFHDWDLATCSELARKAFDVLTSGGRIILHEALFDDDLAGPATVAAFSLYMLVSTKGQQFSFAQLATLLQDAGFVDVACTPAHAYHALVSARKP